MKKLLLLVLILLSVVLGYTFSDYRPFAKDTKESAATTIKKPILRIALVADSHNENDLLRKALRQAQGKGINLVIGLGDYSNVGTIEELNAAKEAFDNSKLPYLVTAGDHDLWDSRNRDGDPLANFKEVFGDPNHQITKDGIQIVILDNSDIYKGISERDWGLLMRLHARSPVASFPPASARSPDSESYAGTETNELRAVGILSTGTTPSLTFVFAHKTPFHPDSKHVMGENSAYVANQAKEFLGLLTKGKVDGFFAGDLHFFAQYQDPTNTVKMTTVGAVASERNFQGPRFAILTVFDDYSWDVEDIEIR